MATREETDELRERPIGEIASRLASDVSDLVRQELQLAKAEMQEKGRIVLPGVELMGGALVVGLCAAGALTACVVLLLAIVLDAWLAALLTGLGLAAIAAVLALMGKERVEKAGTPVPEQTVESVKEDVEWVKKHASSESR